MRGERVTRISLVCLLVLGAAALGAAQDAQVPVQEVTLDNGMKLLIVERHDTPTVAAGWVAHVGSANETYGITGIAHLFEHMMFKGTPTIGTTDHEREAAIMARLDEIRTQMEAEYDRLREAKRRGEVSGSVYEPDNWTPRLVELRDEMKKLQDEQHELIVKDEFDKVYTGAGGSMLNAFTNNDMTAYFITVPANKLELWFWMESDRLLNPVFREFYSERDVVREERRMRVESNPIAKFEEQFDAAFWQASPYHHPVIGWPSDVESITRDQADRFFDTYYAPNNLTAVLVGDLDPERAVALAKRYFGRIPRGEQEPPEVVTEEIDRLQPIALTAEAETNPTVEIRWQTVPFVHKDVWALQVLSDLLTGRTGRLYKSLVEEHGLATGEPYAYVRPMKYAGMFEMGAELTENASHEAVQQALIAEIERLKNEPVPARELEKVQNQNIADSYRRLQNNFFLLVQLLVYDAMGDWTVLNQMSEKIDAVTAEDVMRVAKTYFPADQRVTMWYSRKAGADVDRDLEAIPAQIRPMVKQALNQLAAMTDADQLRQMVEQTRTQLSQVPPEFKPALELIIARTEQRIAEIQAAGETAAEGEEK